MDAKAHIWSPSVAGLSVTIHGEDREHLELMCHELNEIARASGGHLQVMDADGVQYRAGSSEESGIDVSALRF